MQLPRYQVSTLHPAVINSVRFSVGGRHFAVASEAGYEVWRTFPLALIRRRAMPGELALALLLPGTPLLVLQGGGKNPLYPPNKAVIYNDKLGVPVAELEFGERIRGVVVRRGTICIALTRRVVAFEYAMGSTQSTQSSALHDDATFSPGIPAHDTFALTKLGEWQTFLNDQGLAAISTSPGSSVLVLPGRSPGHVQLVSLPPCPAPPSHPLPPSKSSAARPGTFRSPIILAHTHPLSNLACTPDGSKILTSSERGTLLRVWDTARGSLERELRRGVDPAEIWGAEFEPESFKSKEDGKVVGWSDKGTVHVWSRADDAKSSSSGTPSLAHLLSKNLPLPKYFSSTASTAQYRLPRKNPHAFAAMVSAAAGKAGVPSARLSEDDEWAERFIVNWIRVQVPQRSTSPIHPAHPPHLSHIPHVVREKENAAPGVSLSSARSSTSGRKRSIGMGKREERTSFGSDATSRTATPTLWARSETPTLTVRPGHSARQSSLSSTAKPGQVKPPFVHTAAKDKDRDRASSSATFKMPERRSTLSGSTTGGDLGDRTTTELQLVAITYSGDWYRLRIPSAPANDDDPPAKKKGQCELVEYRRLRVGGGGW